MNLWTIARFEFSRFFKWKQELITLLLIVVMAAAGGAWGYFQALSEENRTLAWLSEHTPPELDGYDFVTVSGNLDSALSQYPLVIQLDEQALRLSALEQQAWQQALGQSLQSWWHQQLIERLDLPSELREQIQEPPRLQFDFYDEQGEIASDDSWSDDSLYFFINVIVLVAAFTGFAYMLSSITGEKQQRITEQLLTLVSPQQWIDGKILGISLLAIKTMATTSLIILLFAQGMALYFDGEWLALNLHWHYLLVLGFVLLGLGWVNATMAALAALINDPNHSSRSLLMFIPMLPLLLSFNLMGQLDGTMAQVTSIVPLTSYAVMPMRILAGEAATWEWLLALLLLLPTIWLIRALAARVFAAGIRSYGREIGFSELLYQLTRKNS